MSSDSRRSFLKLPISKSVHRLTTRAGESCAIAVWSKTTVADITEWSEMIGGSMSGLGDMLNQVGIGEDVDNRRGERKLNVIQVNIDVTGNN